MHSEIQPSDMLSCLHFFYHTCGVVNGEALAAFDTEPVTVKPAFPVSTTFPTQKDETVKLATFLAALPEANPAAMLG